MGLKDDHCSIYENTDAENRSAELGILQNSPSGREALYVYVMWDATKADSPDILACVCLEFATKAERNDYAKLLRKNPNIQPGDQQWPYLWSSKKLGNLSSCEVVLGEMLSEWLACWPPERKLK
jgi:hypothetical protein